MADTDVMERTTPRQAVEDWLSSFDKALQSGDPAKAAELFADTSFWRDLVIFTWNIKTVENPSGVRDMLESQLQHIHPSNWQIAEEPAETDGVTEAWLTFETAVGRGKGHVRLKDGKAWTLLTTLQELKDPAPALGPRRPKGVEHGPEPTEKTYKERLDEERETLGYTEQPYVVIVGGGQGGIALGARLRVLGVPTIIVERNDRPGDSWRKRYKSLALHDPVWYDHLPFIPFPKNWPVFSPKDKIGDWLQAYTRIMELNYWTKSEATSATYDPEKGEWEVKVNRDGEEVTLRPKHLVMATGMSGKPNMPQVPGRKKFRGEVQHSSEHSGPDAYKGKKVVVIGSNNSAHDICEALYHAGADVTMAQRSSTHIAKSETLMELALGPIYSEEAVAQGIDHDKADLIFASIPYRIMHEFHIPVYEEMAKRDRDLYDRLEKAGFKLDFGDDGSGLFMKYLRRGSGYYIDVGASELVAQGKIKLKSGQVTEFTETGVKFDDGEELEADLVVFATGYTSMNAWAAELISREVADKVGKVWGLGSDTRKDPGPWEGELRNMWKPTQQEALWFHGGNLHQSRHYSQFLSLQLKARHAGLDTPVYGLQEVHHKA